MTTPERRDELQTNRSYWCDCHACINNWNPGHVLPSAETNYLIYLFINYQLLFQQNKLPKEVAKKISVFFSVCPVQILKQNSQDYDTISPEEINKLMSRIFEVINLIGRYDIYPCEEISQGKSLLYSITRWILCYQSPIES
ncbi:Protein of unknown function [Cotesia congregata]|uniref:Uncharacterized protein n=1 Tax=Cotesia congregata TaxID=51543 RepID=A0A8J2H602_COTCN|nr:Protein of unknown function [Cotesia congregata]